MEETASGSLHASVLPGRCLAELWLLTRSHRTFHPILHLIFPPSHPSTGQPDAGKALEVESCCGDCAGKTKRGLCSPSPSRNCFHQGDTQTVTLGQPGISLCPSKRDFFPPLTIFLAVLKALLPAVRQSHLLLLCSSLVVCLALSY